jgi:hypothetical protein
MQIDSEERQRWRRAYVARFLAAFGLASEVLAPSTQDHLVEWARQAKLVEEQPSSNLQSVILQLCKAVESELAAGLGSLRQLSFLRDGALGQKAAKIKSVQLKEETSQQLESWGIKPAFVLSELPALLSRLAKLRRETHAAHGNVEMHSTSLDESNQARQLAGQILQSVARKTLK